MRFGVQIAGGVSAAEWLAKVRHAEELGFSTVLLPDHLDGTIAPWSSLATAAQLTRRIRIGTYVLNNDLRHPAVVAQEVATLDQLSEGRFELGLGAGWSEIEYAETGIPFDAAGVRVERLQESVHVLKALFSGEPVTFAGKHFALANHRIVRTPVQRPHPPILLGGSSDRLLTLAAREADIVAVLAFHVRDGQWRFTTFAANDLEPKLQLVKRAAGDRFAQLELNAFVWYVTAGPSPRAAAEATRFDPSISIEDAIGSPFALLGTARDMAHKLQEARDRFGITYWVVGSEDMDTIAPVIQMVV